MYQLNHMKCLRVLAAGYFLLAAGCGTGNLRVVSNPEKADIYVTPEGEQPKKIGETPLNVSADAINPGRGRYVNVSVRKEGFESESVLVPVNLFGNSVDISAKLEQTVLPKVCIDQSAAVEKISRGVATVQAMMNRGSPEEARQKINDLLSEYSGVSVLYDLLGNVHYVQKNLEQALASYQRSLSIEPNNMDTQRMVTKIRSIVEIRVPAGGQ
jgi:tetratricopeptide (TPR) repeat protein